MENRYKINYDIKQRCITNIKFKQGDSDSSVIEVDLFDDGKVIDITGEIIEFRFLKPDKTIVSQDSTSGVNIINATDGATECVLKANTLASVGLVRAEMVRKKDGIILTTPTFYFTVDSTIGGIFLSSNYIVSIENKMIEWQLNEDLRQNVFTENENVRMNQATTGEQSRQSTFVSNENERQNTFNASETNRSNTFNVNEIARQTGMDDIQNRFNNLTVAQQQAAEVVDSRSSTVKGKAFATLDARLEAIEKDTPNLVNADLNKKYTYKLQVTNAQPQLILEEVL